MARLTTTLRGVAGALLASTIVFVASGLQWQTQRNISAFLALGASESPYMIPVEYPSYSPDGREVAFNTFWPGGMEIFAASTIDGRLRPIVQQGPRNPTRVGVHPAWSPDGKWIAFATESASGVRSNIWLIHPDGSGLTQLTRGSTHDDEPAWSPDGTRIAFTSRDYLASGRNDIWVVNVDGSGLQQVTSSAQSWLPGFPQDAYRPSFSPGGNQIVFSQGGSPEAMGGCSSNKLVVVSADGSGTRQLTSGPTEPETARVFDWTPNWSKQGILFSRRGCGSANQIMMIQPNGIGMHAIVNVTGWDPTWSPVGTKFAFVRGGDYVYNVSGWGIYEHDFTTRATRALVQIRGFLIPIHIMPEPSPKVVSLKGTPLIRVVIPPQPDFDWVKAVDQTSITFGRSGDEHSLASCAAEGTNLVCHFKTGLTSFRPGDTQGILRLVAVHTYPDGTTARFRYEGRDTIQIVP